MPFTPTQLPSGRWQGGFRHPVTRRKITRTFDYAYEAESWAVLEEQRARAGATEPASTLQVPDRPATWLGPTLGNYGRAYLDRRAGLLARATRDKYGSHLRGLTVPYSDTGPMAARHMGTLRRPDVEQWITDQLAANVGRPTINARLLFVRMLFADLLDQDDAPITRDPTAGLKPLTEDLTTDRIVTDAEEARMLTSSGPQLRAACMVALDAGLRWQEVYALRAEAIAGDYIVVTHALERGQQLRAYTKGKRRRVVPMTERLVDELAPFVEAGGLLFPALGRDGAPTSSPWDHANHRKREWAPMLHAVGLGERIEVPTNRIRRYTTEAGPAGSPIMQVRYVPGFGFHALRHTCGSRWAAAGVPRSEIAALLGHADESMTARYIHTGDDGRRLALVRGAQRRRLDVA